MLEQEKRRRLLTLLEQEFGPVAVGARPKLSIVREERQKVTMRPMPRPSRDAMLRWGREHWPDGRRAASG